MKRKPPKISIVTPSFNQGKYLEDTIQSILNQKYPNLEYIIIDGGSTDKSVKIIKKYEKYLKYWESKPDNGQADALNKGFSHMTGEIMTWLNSDDILMPGTLQLIANIFTQTKDIHWISGIPTTINEDGFLMYFGRKRAYIQKCVEWGWYHGAFLGYIMQEGSFWTRTLWEKAGSKIKNLPYSLDFDLWKRFAEYEKLVPIFTSLAAYRLNPNRKNVTGENYYKEIGIFLPKYMKIVTYPFKLFTHYCIRKSRGSSKIFYSERKNTWIYREGWLDNNIFSLKTKFINNKSIV